jgi:hypothetical protein
MRDALDQPRLIYVMRHPVDRLISQYIHAWSQGELRCDLEGALTTHPELVAYSCYARQLAPFIETYGEVSILPVFFDRLLLDPQGELERVCRFIGYGGEVRWHDDVSRRNVSSERFRKFPLYDVVVEHPLSTKLRRLLVPKAVRNAIQQSLSMTDRPVLNDKARKEVETIFDSDLAILGSWLGVKLNCRNFCTLTSSQQLEWR